MSWTWLGLAVLVLLAFSMVDGYQKGFVKRSGIRIPCADLSCNGMADQSLCESVYP